MNSPDVGEAFYNYLLSVDVTDFCAQKFPITKAKELSKVLSLSLPFLFLKEMYVLKKIGLDRIKRNELFDAFELYLTSNHYKCKPDRNTFYAKLESVGIVHKKSNGDNVYLPMTAEDLLAIATKNKWLHESDDYDCVDPIDELCEVDEMIAELLLKKKRLESMIAEAKLQSKKEEPKAEAEEKVTLKESKAARKAVQEEVTTDMLDSSTKFAKMTNAFIKPLEKQAKRVFKEFFHDDDALAASMTD
jgi:hypothetical protein